MLVQMAAVHKDFALRTKGKTGIQAQRIAKYGSIFPDQSDLHRLGPIKLK